MTDFYYFKEKTHGVYVVQLKNPFILIMQAEYMLKQNKQEGNKHISSVSITWSPC